MTDFSLETLDFETLEKISKSLAMIDEQFGGNTTMKRAILNNYGLSLDDFPTVFEPSPVAKETEQRAIQAQQANEMESLKLQEKLIYGDKWFVLQNRLLNAITNLDLNERRLIMFLSPMVRKDVEDYPNKNRRVFVVKALDFAKTYGIDNANTYGILADTADKILTKAFWYWNFKDDKPFGEKTYKSGITWVSKCNYLDKQGELSIILNDEIVEMLTVFDKANPFTKYQIDAIIKLGCYGIILFELIVSCLHQDFRQKTYTINYLKEKFNCINNYKTYYDFKRYVLDRAIKEIHENTTIRVSYEQKKIGRKVSELLFSFEDTSQKKVGKTKEKNSKSKNENNNPFVNFKMTQKQLSLFATKIKKANGQDVEEIMAELSNVHLQAKHVDFLKSLDFVPSAWYSDDEAKEHPTAEQIAQAKADEKARVKAEKEQKQRQLKQDFEKLVDNAELFVKSNLKRVSKTGIEQMYFKENNYAGVVKAWEHDLLNENTRKHFAMIDEILAM